MPACVQIDGSRKGRIEISGSLVCGLNYDDKRIWLVSSEGYFLLSGEEYKLYTDTIDDEL